MKIKELARLQKNKTNCQVSLQLRARALRKAGISPSDLLNVRVPENLVKIKQGKIYI